MDPATRRPHRCLRDLGDPNLYSTFTNLADAVRAFAPGASVQTVPGITALQDLAARSGTVLAHGDQTLALVPVLDTTAALHDALERFDSVIVYKAARRTAQILNVLARTGRLQHARYGEQLGRTDERIIPAAAELEHHPHPYMSTVLVVPSQSAERA